MRPAGEEQALKPLSEINMPTALKWRPAPAIPRHYDPENTFFTSITAYDNDKYLMEDVRSISSHTWDKNSDGTITVSFNCGENAPNNIDTQGNNFTFTSRHYGVNPKVITVPKTLLFRHLKRSRHCRFWHGTRRVNTGSPVSSTTFLTAAHLNRAALNSLL